MSNFFSIFFEIETLVNDCLLTYNSFVEEDDDDDDFDDDDGDDDDDEAGTLLRHSSLRDCNGNVQQSVSALRIVIIIVIVIIIAVIIIIKIIIIIIITILPGDFAGVRRAAFFLSECVWKDPTGAVRF